jgi:anti-anti-sigma factor
MSTDPFSISVTPDGDQVFVSPAGEIDMATVGALRTRMAELGEQGFARVVLDLRAVTFIDSSGLKLILDGISEKRSGFGVVAGPEPVQRMFEILGITDVIPFVPAPTSD